MPRVLAIGLGAICMLAAMLLAQAPPLGSEFQANTHTTARQSSPAVASRGDGTFVVVWNSTNEDGSGSGIFGQRFDNLGVKTGPEFQVNSYTTGSQYNPSVAARRNGEFVVVWHSATYENQDGSGSGVFGQRFTGAGVKIGGEFPVNTYTTDHQTSPMVAMDPGSGDFLVVWTTGIATPDSNIQAQKFASSGAKVGPEFRVNTYTPSFQSLPSIEPTGGGGFVVVWAGTTAPDTVYEVSGQRLGPSGQKVGPEFSVNTYTTLRQSRPAVTSDPHGNFLVAWASYTQDGSDDGIFGQRFNGSAEKVGSEFRINTFTTGIQSRPAAATAPNGDFLVTWFSQDQDGSDKGIFGQRLDRSGGAIGTEFPLNVYTTSIQARPAVASDGGGFVVVWESKYQDGDSYGVFGRREDLRPVSIAVDAHGIGTSDLNGVLEAGEAVVVEPAWTSSSALPLETLEGTVGDLSGPSGPLYQLLDGVAGYGPPPAGVLVDCNDGNPNPCYALQITGSRPAIHWDAALREDLNFGGSQFWKLHLGDSFADVPRSQPFYKKIEAVLHHGITSGCNGTQYCPDALIPRSQMAIFVAKGIAGLGENVPVTGTVFGTPYSCTAGGHSVFTDVAVTDSFCRHVHYTAAQNVTVGCAGGMYCPGSNIGRAEMAGFVAKAIVAPAGGGAVPVSYTDAGTGRSYACVAGSANLHFTDVPVGNAFCRHIHFLWAKGIVAGCSPTQYCPNAAVRRDEMAKFIANAFNLQLYSP